MRFSGHLKTWDDDRGFGFIEPEQGGQDLFVHIKSVLNRGSERPQVGHRVSFEVELGPQGRKRAHKVLLDTASHRRTPPRRPLPPRRAQAGEWGGASTFAIPAFLGLVLVVALTWGLARIVVHLYVAASVVCGLAYWLDKRAAQRGRKRISERSLLLLGLAGGWPGAILAQQMLRHKSVKPSFRRAFWVTVGVNVCAFVVLASPWARGFLAG